MRLYLWQVNSCWSRFLHYSCQAVSIVVNVHWYCWIETLHFRFFDVTVFIYLQAYHQEMLFPNYVWITYGWFSPEWWTGHTRNCTPDEISSVLAGSIAVSHFPNHQLLNVTVNLYTLSVYSRYFYGVQFLLLITTGIIRENNRPSFVT